MVSCLRIFSLVNSASAFEALLRLL
jgi:hypothetical protein